METFLSSIPQIHLGVWLAIAGAAAFAAAFLLFSSLQTVYLERRDLNRTLRSVRAIELPDSRAIRRRELAVPASERVLGPALNRAATFARRITPLGTVERLEGWLDQAGSPFGWDAARLLAFKVIFPALMVLLVIFLGPAGGFGFVQIALSIVFVVFLGWFLPDFFLRSRAGARQHQIQLSLPDGLDLLSITVEAGLGFDSALNRVAGEVEGPLGQEFHRVVQEIQLGEERIEALRSLADRNDVAELKTFVLAMVQADILGIAVSQVLEVQAREMRIKRRQRAEERAMKLPVKLVFPVVLCIFPALLLVMLGPAAIQIYENVFTALN
jgi:tight adherence protein C